VSENEAGANAHGGGKINFEIVFSAIEKAGKSLTIEMYPGENHWFYWDNRTSEETVIKVVSTTRAFIDPLLKTKPAC
jgi:dipeptidyl aminopeptidase/acylaminoacyl peptidase